MPGNINLRITWRYLLKDRLSTTLNLIGLSSGLACALLIFIWVGDELKMDKFHQKGERLYMVKENRIKSGGIWTAPTTSGPMAEALAKDFPEVEYAATVGYADDITLTAGQNNIRATGRYVSRNFFNVFTYPLLSGVKDNILQDENSILLSDVLAKKLFGSEAAALGKPLTGQHKDNYFVSGVFQDPGVHSSEQFDFVLPLEPRMKKAPWMASWGNTGARTYLTLKPGSNATVFNNNIAGYVKKATNGEIKHRTPFITLYSDQYLYGDYKNGVVSGGRIDYVHLFSIIAVFILVIACINFMNLSTAKAARRTKEVGIRKVVGARRGGLILQYLGESLIITAFSVLLALLLVLLVLPAFNNITGKQLTLDFDWKLTAAVLGVTLFTGLVAGSYPALYLSGFKPGLILKGKFSSAAGEVFARKGLVVFQFTLSVFLIVSVLVVYKQIKYVQSKNLGFDKNNVISFTKEGKFENGHVQEAFLAEVRKSPSVENASSLGHSLTGHNSGTYGVGWPGRDPQDKTEFENITVDYGLVQTMGMEIAAGREFSKNYGTDTLGIMFNEAAIKYMGMKDPVGKLVTLWGEQRHIIGVVKDFNFESLHKDIGPVFFRLDPGASRFMVRIKPGREKEAIRDLQNLYSKFNPGFAFEYTFLDERFQTLYAAEQRVSVLSRYFAGLAILISCLGLFGLTAFTAQRRQKEISIRKVIGATAGNIVVMLSADFLKLLLVAVVVAFPLSWWAVNQWLKGFAYRTSVNAGIFAIAGLSIFLITIITISFQSLKAALSNPVKHLKNE
jgi:predicted permease